MYILDVCFFNVFSSTRESKRKWAQKTEKIWRRLREHGSSFLVKAPSLVGTKLELFLKQEISSLTWLLPRPLTFINAAIQAQIKRLAHISDLHLCIGKFQSLNHLCGHCLRTTCVSDLQFLAGFSFSLRKKQNLWEEMTFPEVKGHLTNRFLLALFSLQYDFCNYDNFPELPLSPSQCGGRFWKRLPLATGAAHFLFPPSSSLSLSHFLSS